jgi:hypothetical protein
VLEPDHRIRFFSQRYDRLVAGRPVGQARLFIPVALHQATAQACRTRYKRVPYIPPELNAGRDICGVRNRKNPARSLDKGRQVRYNNRAFGNGS